LGVHSALREQLKGVRAVMPAARAVIGARRNAKSAPLSLQAENVARKATLKKRTAHAGAPEGAKSGAGAGEEGGPARKQRKKREWWEEELDAATGKQRVYAPDDDAAYYREEVPI
jgi:hypothetical protein